MNVIKISDTLYYRDDQNRLHREEGPAFITKYERNWYKHGKRHRIGGPAEEYKRSKLEYYFSWFVDGIRHNEYAPAVIMSDFYELIMIDELSIPHMYVNGEVHIWFINDKNITEEVKSYMDAGKIHWDYKEWSVRDKTIFKLKFL